jgi:F-type H+-transporting ATPase subunit epsilon
MSKKIHCSVLTPERLVYEGDVDAVVAVMHDGERGFLPSHAPIVANLGIGAMRLQNDGVHTLIEVEGGFAEFSRNRLIVLAEEAMRCEELSEKQIRFEIEQLEIDERSASPDRRKKIAAQKRKLASRLQVVTK